MTSGPQRDIHRQRDREKARSLSDVVHADYRTTRGHARIAAAVRTERDDVPRLLNMFGKGVYNGRLPMLASLHVSNRVPFEERARRKSTWKSRAYAERADGEDTSIRKYGTSLQLTALQSSVCSMKSSTRLIM
jgi:hypothetical protein